MRIMTKIVEVKNDTNVYSSTTPGADNLLATYKVGDRILVSIARFGNTFKTYHHVYVRDGVVGFIHKNKIKEIEVEYCV